MTNGGVEGGWSCSSSFSGSLSEQSDGVGADSIVCIICDVPWLLVAGSVDVFDPTENNPVGDVDEPEDEDCACGRG